MNLIGISFDVESIIVTDLTFSFYTGIKP